LLGSKNIGLEILLDFQVLATENLTDARTANNFTSGTIDQNIPARKDPALPSVKYSLSVVKAAWNHRFFSADFSHFDL